VDSGNCLICSRTRLIASFTLYHSHHSDSRAIKAVARTSVTPIRSVAYLVSRLSAIGRLPNVTPATLVMMFFANSQALRNDSLAVSPCFLSVFAVLQIADLL
jgi:hypothetical protein